MGEILLFLNGISGIIILLFYEERNEEGVV